MEWGVFVNWLRRGLLTVTLVVVLLVASLTGWLGAGTQDVVSRSLTTFGSFLTAHATALDQIWKLLGGVVTLISGSWLIYKMWYYADHNMPIRIAQFLKKHRLRFSEIRSALLNVIEGRRPSTPQNMPICLVGPLNVALRQVGLGKMDGALENLERSIISFENQRMVRQREAELFNAQLAGSYLLKGVILCLLAVLSG